MAVIQSNQENKYLHKVYRNITCLGVLLHTTYAIMFAFLNYQSAFIYNFLDIVFYFSMMFLVIKLNRYSLVVSLIHLESMLFCVFHTFLFGWNPTFYIFLMAMASLVYFCPFRSIYTPYVYSFFHIMVFFFLYSYSSIYSELISIDDALAKLFFICNCVSAFTIILYVGYVSKASASVGRKELIAQNANLQQLTNYDQMTGLYNKTCLRNRFSHANRNIILAIGDIDDFKVINDTYGHICGDIILKELAEQMRLKLDPNIFSCRWGGEEFVFVFSSNTLEEAKEQLEAFNHWIENYAFQYQDSCIHLTMTFGIVQGEDQLSIDEWIDKADRLLYKGKHLGKNKVITK